MSQNMTKSPLLYATHAPASFCECGGWFGLVGSPNVRADRPGGRRSDLEGRGGGDPRTRMCRDIKVNRLRMLRPHALSRFKSKQPTQYEISHIWSGSAEVRWVLLVLRPRGHVGSTDNGATGTIYAGTISVMCELLGDILWYSRLSCVIVI